MKPKWRLASTFLAGFVILAASCSDASDQTERELAPASQTASATAAATPTTEVPTTGPPPPAPTFIDVVGTNLQQLGLPAQQVHCIADGLEAHPVDPEALAAGDLASVIVFDQVARTCAVDLLDHVQ